MGNKPSAWSGGLKAEGGEGKYPFFCLLPETHLGTAGALFIPSCSRGAELELGFFQWLSLNTLSKGLVQKRLFCACILTRLLLIPGSQKKRETYLKTLVKRAVTNLS